MHDDLLGTAVRAVGLGPGAVDFQIGAASAALKIDDACFSCELLIHVASGETLLAVKIILENGHGLSLIFGDPVGKLRDALHIGLECRKSIHIQFIEIFFHIHKVLRAVGGDLRKLGTERGGSIRIIHQARAHIVQIHLFLGRDDAVGFGDVIAKRDSGKGDICDRRALIR